MNEETTSKPQIKVTALKEPVTIQLPSLSEMRARTAVEADAARHAQKIKEENASRDTFYGFGADEVKDSDLAYGIPYGIGSWAPPPPTASQVLRQALIESKEPSHPKPVTPKQPSDIALFLGLLLFMVAVAGVISLGFWYAWPAIRKHAEEKGWTEPTAKPPKTIAVTAVPAPATKVTYYHVSCVSQLETGRVTFHEFHYSLTDGDPSEPVNPLVLLHNLRLHAAQMAGSSNIIILAVSQLPGGAK